MHASRVTAPVLSLIYATVLVYLCDRPRIFVSMWNSAVGPFSACCPCAAVLPPEPPCVLAVLLGVDIPVLQ